MKRMIFIILITLLSSCIKKEPIYYQYKEVTITRIDIGNEIYFYYDLCGKENQPCSKPYIKAVFSGLNSGVGAYLAFRSDNKVELIKMYDSFEKVGIDTSFLLKEYDNIDFISWQERINGDYNNVVYISDIVETEKTLNHVNHSNVKVIYPK